VPAGYFPGLATFDFSQNFHDLRHLLSCTSNSNYLKNARCLLCMPAVR
jgi:hypothetical protein